MVIKPSDGWDPKQREEENQGWRVMWGYSYKKTYNPHTVDVLNDIIQRLEKLEQTSGETRQ